RRALISRIVPYEFFPIEVGIAESGLDKLAHAVAFTGRQKEVVSFSMLHNPPDAFDILRRVSPITFCIDVSEKQFLLQSVFDRGNCARDFASDEGFAATWALVIEHDAV